MSEINENIIIRFLMGEATEKEAKQIFDWKNINSENRKTFREIETAFNTSEIMLNPEEFDKNSAYLRIRELLQSEKESKIRKIDIKQLLKYAATIIIAIGLTWFTQSYFNERRFESNQTVETPTGARSLVTLEDGTKIWLNANSKLTYPTHFNKNQRIVKLEGEGYFDVAKDKTCPFKVETSDLSINVLGTVFNLKSYPDEGFIETTLIEGKIILNKSMKNKSEKEILELKPHQKALFIKREGLLLDDQLLAANIPASEREKRSKEKLIVEKDVKTGLVAAWKDNKMIFEDETFESIAVRLQRRYGAEIRFADVEVKDYRYSGIFEEISIEQALIALQFASYFNFEINKNIITIKK